MKKRGLWLLSLMLLILMGCSKSYEEYMQLAAENESAGDYAKATDMAIQAIDKAETETALLESNLKAGDILLYNLENPDSAGQYYAAALGHASSLGAEDSYALIKKALEANAAKAAVAGYADWIERFKDDPQVAHRYYEMAEVYHKNIRDLRTAVKLYEEITHRYPQSEEAPKALFSIGYIYANELMENDKAQEYYSRFLETYPDHEMVPSVEFELKYLGKSLEEIPELQKLLSNPS